MKAIEKRIELSHGAGGQESAELIEGLFFRYFQNDLLKAEDAARFMIEGEMAMTTDAYTVTPLFFAGGDIGKLSIAGTVNDLSMMGARPLYVAVSLIIEEGFLWEELEKIVQSMAQELEVCGAKIVCGDTKVVPKGSADKLFITTTGVGKILRKNLSAAAVPVGDVIILSGSVGRHGATLLGAREGFGVTSNLSSDCTTLWPAVSRLIDAGISIAAMRDATRGGLAAVLNEWAKASNVCLEIEAAAIPVNDAVKGMCEIFGFNALELANEGTFVLSVAPMHAGFALEALKEAGFLEACVIGRVTQNHAGRVVLFTPQGSSRFLDMPQGELLPRIC